MQEANQCIAYLINSSEEDTRRLKELQCCMDSTLESVRSHFIIELEECRERITRLIHEKEEIQNEMVRRLEEARCHFDDELERLLKKLRQDKQCSDGDVVDLREKLQKEKDKNEQLEREYKEMKDKLEYEVDKCQREKDLLKDRLGSGDESSCSYKKQIIELNVRIEQLLIQLEKYKCKRTVLRVRIQKLKCHETVSSSSSSDDEC